MVDTEHRVKMWQGRSEDLWGLRPGEVFDEPLMSLDIGLPMEELRKLIRDCENDPGRVHEIELEATNRRGRAIHCRIVGSTLTLERSGDGVIMVIEELRDR